MIPVTGAEKLPKIRSPERDVSLRGCDYGRIPNPDIPILLKSVPLQSLEVLKGPGDSYYATMQNVRLSLENCLQDHMYDYVVSLKGDLLVIEPASDVDEVVG